MEFVPSPNDAPFVRDASATAAFAALDGAEGFDALDETVNAVVIGGGTGAPVSLRTLLSLGANTSAIVAMADDGGSTGILREEANVTPPGDIRKCIAAMAADPEDPLTRAFKYRFTFARNHTLGNLMLSALEDATGSFPEAIAICERLLGARGKVYPSTLARVTLSARTRDGRQLVGQAVACHSRTALERVQLHGEAIEAYQPALDAIRAADLIVLGPGSLFTSIIPNLLVPGVVDAIRESHGACVFVCSLADMQGETWGLTAREHYEALCDHGMRGLVDYMLVHVPEELSLEGLTDEAFAAAVGEQTRLRGESGSPDPDAQRVRPVTITYQDARAIQEQGTVVLARNLVDPERPTWHGPKALREAFVRVLKLCRSRRR